MTYQNDQNALKFNTADRKMGEKKHQENSVKKSKTSISKINSVRGPRSKLYLRRKKGDRSISINNDCSAMRTWEKRSIHRSLLESIQDNAVKGIKNEIIDEERTRITGFEDSGEHYCMMKMFNKERHNVRIE